MASTAVTNEVAIGIDFGTSFSAVAVYETKTKRMRVLKDNEGHVVTPSLVAFTTTQQLTGYRALQQIAENPENTVAEVKRLMGRRFAESQVQEDARRWPFTLVDKDGEPRLQVNFRCETRLYRPEQISAMILLHLKKLACEDLNLKPFASLDAVLTVPVNFGDSQRLAIREACQIASINVLRFITEPAAVALAYAWDEIQNKGMPIKGSRSILVFDMGGGTTDVSLMKLGENNEYEVLACVGANDLGGEDLDTLLVNFCCDKFKVNLKGNRPALVRLRLQCEQAKCRLSTANSTEIKVDEILIGHNLSINVTRSEFEKLIYDKLRLAANLIIKCMKEANVTPTDITKVVLAGGSSRIPLMSILICDVLPGVSIQSTLIQDETVACGGALQAAQDKKLMTINLQLHEKIPWSLGVELFDGTNSVLIKKNSKIPVKNTGVYHTAYDYQKAICFKVYEGEHHISKNNHFLGKFTLCGIKEALAKVTEADLTYEIDKHGILHCTATEKKAGEENTISISIERYKKLLTAQEVEGYNQQAESEHVQGLVHDLCHQVEALKTEVNADQFGVVQDQAARAFSWVKENPTPSKTQFGELVTELQQNLKPCGITISNLGTVIKKK